MAGRLRLNTGFFRRSAICRWSQDRIGSQQIYIFPEEKYGKKQKQAGEELPSKKKKRMCLTFDTPPFPFNTIRLIRPAPG
jgi:hypothetical protein